MRLLWLPLVLSLAERLYPVVREEDGKKIVACWCFQPVFFRLRFCFSVICFLHFHCNGFWWCHHPVSAIHLFLLELKDALHFSPQ